LGVAALTVALTVTLGRGLYVEARRCAQLALAVLVGSLVLELLPRRACTDNCAQNAFSAKLSLFRL